MSNIPTFNGGVPRNYQDILTPFLFDSFSAKLIEQIGFTRKQNILELACGTGSLTRQLAKHMPTGSKLTATDLQADMLEIAKSYIANSNDILWEVADMTAIPYADDLYDLIVCQFGLMLVPDRKKAVAEVHRGLKKGGRFIYTVWAGIENNPAWEICGQVIERYMGVNPMPNDPGPFSLSEKDDNLQMLQQAGFTEVRAALTQQASQTGSAALAAKGFIQGLPFFSMIARKDPSLIGQIETELAAQFAQKLGDSPLTTSSQAWVVEGIK